MNDFSNHLTARRQFVLGVATLMAAASFPKYAMPGQNGMQPMLQGIPFPGSRVPGHSEAGMLTHVVTQ